MSQKGDELQDGIELHQSNGGRWFTLATQIGPERAPSGGSMTTGIEILGTPDRQWVLEILGTHPDMHKLPLSLQKHNVLCSKCYKVMNLGMRHGFTCGCEAGEELGTAEAVYRNPVLWARVIEAMGRPVKIAGLE